MFGFDLVVGLRQGKERSYFYTGKWLLLPTHRSAHGSKSKVCRFNWKTSKTFPRHQTSWHVRVSLLFMAFLVVAAHLRAQRTTTRNSGFCARRPRAGRWRVRVDAARRSRSSRQKREGARSEEERTARQETAALTQVAVSWNDRWRSHRVSWSPKLIFDHFSRSLLHIDTCLESWWRKYNVLVTNPPNSNPTRPRCSVARVTQYTVVTIDRHYFSPFPYLHVGRCRILILWDHFYFGLCQHHSFISHFSLTDRRPFRRLKPM